MKKTIIASVLALSLIAGGIRLYYTNEVTAIQQKPMVRSIIKIDPSKEGINNYKKGLMKKIDKLAVDVAADENIFVTVTFNKPLNYTQLAKIIEDYNFNVKSILGRAIEKKSKLRATLSVAPSNGQLYDKKILKSMVTRNDGEFKGFIELVGSVNNNQLKALTQENHVFSVDPSADNNLVQNPKNTSMQGLYWDLEDANMIIEQE